MPPPYHGAENRWKQSAARDRAKLGVNRMNQTEWANLYDLHLRVGRYARPRALEADDFADLEMLEDAVAGSMSFFAKGLFPDDPDTRVRRLIAYSEAIHSAMLTNRYAEERDLLIAGFALWCADLVVKALSRGSHETLKG